MEILNFEAVDMEKAIKVVDMANYLYDTLKSEIEYDVWVGDIDNYNDGDTYDFENEENSVTIIKDTNGKAVMLIACIEELSLALWNYWEKELGVA